MSVDITLVSPGLGRTGGFRTICEWANRLTHTGRRVVLATPLDGPGRDYLASEVEVRMPPRAAQIAVRAAMKAVRPAAGGTIDLEVLPRFGRHCIPGGGRVILAFLPWQFGFDIDDRWTAYCQHWEPVNFSDERARRRAERAMQWAGPLIVNSSWLRKQFDAGRSAALAFPGVDLNVFRPAVNPVARASLRVVALGRTDLEWKGVADLLAAVEKLPGPLELVLFGCQRTGDEDRPWGQLRRLGPLASADLSTLLASADMVICPSWFESFPLPPLEAMACGTAVVTTSIGTEDYAVDRHNALVIPAKDSTAMAAAIAELLDDVELRNTLAGNGLDTARRFSWEAGFETFEAALAATG